MIFRLLSLLLIACTALPDSACADDMYAMAQGVTVTDRGEGYERMMLRMALEATRPQYGSYKVSIAPLSMQHWRVLREVADGKLTNITVQVTNPEWEKTLIPVRIPIDKGLASFRISLIDGRRQDEFSRIASSAQLRQLSVGAGEQWATRDVYEKLGLHVVTGDNYDGLFGMLMSKRFDYMPRSIEEALLEQPEQVAHYPNLAIEQSFVLYVPAPRYFFVSPKMPRLAERLRVGMEKLIASGELDRIFAKHYGPLIVKAGLCNRTMFKMDNPDLGPNTPLQRTNLWFDPFTGSGRELACPSRSVAAKKTLAP